VTFYRQCNHYKNLNFWYKICPLQRRFWGYSAKFGLLISPKKSPGNRPKYRKLPKCIKSPECLKLPNLVTLVSSQSENCNKEKKSFRHCQKGCQIFLDTIFQNGEKLPNAHNITNSTSSIPNGLKTFQRTIKYTNIFHSKALQNLPKLGFLVRKYTIWQP
jgi:hypothetical protein